MSLNEKCFDILPLIKGQARFLIGNPLLLIFLLSGTFVCAFISYQMILNNPAKAGAAAGLFSLTWGLIYVVAPYFIVLFIVAIILIVIAGIVFIGFEAGGAGGAGVTGAGVGIAAVVLALICGAIGLGLIFGPGYLTYEWVKSNYDSQITAIVAALGVTVAVFLLCAFLYRFIFPILFTILWVVYSGHLSLKAVSLVMGTSEFADFSKELSSIDIPESTDAAMQLAYELIDIYLAYLPPGPLMFIILIYGVIVSMAVVVKGSQLENVKIILFQLKRTSSPIEKAE